MPVPLYLDADVHPVVARIPRGREIDAVSSSEAGNVAASDRDQLDFARARGRAIVTFNVVEFVRLPGYAQLLRPLVEALERRSAP